MPQSPRILILTAYYFPFQGGSETHAREVATYLAAIGFGVVIVTKRTGTRTEETGSLEKPGLLLDGIPVHRVAPAGPRTGLRKWVMIPFALWKIVRLRRAFDLIYCPGYQGIGIAAVVAGRLLGRPVILRSGNLGVLKGNNWNEPLSRSGISTDNWVVTRLKQGLRNLYMRADGFVCNCREIEQEALSCHVPPAHVHYVPNAVDVERYRLPDAGERARIRSEVGWPVEAFLCLYVGRLSIEKGVLDLLEAWRTIRRENAVLVLVGPDMTGHPIDAGPAARAFVAAHGMQQQVIFHGASTDVARLFRAADMYVQPSHYEAFSNAVIEAMATGLPLVASGVGGMLDCVVDSENGLLCPPANPSALASQIRRLMDDPALAQRLGSNARQTVVTSFEKTTTLRKLADLFVATARST
jgi:glycosyltransferase involved in cell wall biosynthesis